MSAACTRAQALLGRGLEAGALDAGDGKQLWSHLGGCAACRAHYDRTIVGERLLASGGKDAARPAPVELALFRARVVALSAAKEPARAGSVSKLWSRLLAGAAAAAVAGLAAVVGLPPGDEWQARAGSGGQLSIRAFCESGSGDQATIRAVSDAPGPEELAACPPSSAIRFAYLAARDGFLLVLRRSAGKVEWLMPAGDAGPPKVTVLARPTPIPAQVRPPLPAGGVELVFVLSDAPLPRAEVQRAVEAERDAAAIERKLGASVVVRHVRVAPP